MLHEFVDCCDDVVAIDSDFLQIKCNVVQRYSISNMNAFGIC